MIMRRPVEKWIDVSQTLTSVLKFLTSLVALLYSYGVGNEKQ